MWNCMGSYAVTVAVRPLVKLGQARAMPGYSPKIYGVLCPGCLIKYLSKFRWFSYSSLSLLRCWNSAEQYRNPRKLMATVWLFTLHITKKAGPARGAETAVWDSARDEWALANEIQNFTSHVKFSRNLQRIYNFSALLFQLLTQTKLADGKSRFTNY